MFQKKKLDKKSKLLNQEHEERQVAEAMVRWGEMQVAEAMVR